ncbi:MAG: FHA domain-containing protein [Bacteriovoracaceae bacterium]|nr:FHA domain-containing protein [Bacteriovoracaceae bacterium]
MKKTALLLKEMYRDEEKTFFLEEISGEQYLGTSDGVDIKINDWRCSGIHALIKNEADGIKVIDLGSSFGTYFNDKPITEIKIKNDEVFKIGEHQLYFKELDETELSKFPKYDVKKTTVASEQELILSSEKTVLEVSLFWGEKILEVQQFSQGSHISIGNPRLATFGIPEELLPDSAIKEQKFELANYAKGQLTLTVPKLANGLIWNGGDVINLDTLRLYNKNFVGKDFFQLNLRMGDRAHIEFGELIITFRFINPAKKIKGSILPKFDKQLSKIIGGLLAFYVLLVLVLSIPEAEQKEKKIEDIPKHLKKVVYDVGIKSAKEKQQSAIGQIAQNQGGRARAEEGKSSAKKSDKEKALEKADAKKPTEQAEAAEAKSKAVAQTNTAEKKIEMVNLDNAFAKAAPSAVSNTDAILSNTKADGNSASAIADGGFARGNKGLGSGGGGESVGIGALKGQGIGGGMGAGDYGLNPSKGTEIRIPDEEEIEIVGGLDPEVIAKIIKRYLPQIQYCYEQQLVAKPYIKGKVAIAFTITAEGAVAVPKITESTLKDSPTEACIVDKVKDWKFPKPKGGGTVGVNYPFILMSNNAK